MAIIGIQGLRGGTGATSITAGLAWSLQHLDESVLVIDGSPDNMLRLFFNVDFKHTDGWARAIMANEHWAQTAWRYTEHLHVLPFGQYTECSGFGTLADLAVGMLKQLRERSVWRWILIDLPATNDPLTRALAQQVDACLMVINPDMNCHVRLHQQPVPQGARLLVNNLLVASQLQDDIWQMWLHSQLALVPLVIHRDEAMAESLAAKQPVGEFRADALASEELNTLASWCLLNFAEQR